MRRGGMGSFRKLEARRPALACVVIAHRLVGVEVNREGDEAVLHYRVEADLHRVDVVGQRVADGLELGCVLLSAVRGVQVTQARRNGLRSTLSRILKNRHRKLFGLKETRAFFHN